MRRELARRAGVSHAAPRRHFADRQALLDALAEAGFTRLAGEVRAAIDGAGGDYPARLCAAAVAYVRFATRDTALIELMFAAKNAGDSAGLREAAARLFAVIGDLIGQGQQAGALPLGDPHQLQLLFGAGMTAAAAVFAVGPASACAHRGPPRRGLEQRVGHARGAGCPA
jgi:AcrR family transcriptional regulator